MMQNRGGGVKYMHCRSSWYDTTSKKDKEFINCFIIIIFKKKMFKIGIRRGFESIIFKVQGEANKISLK